MTEKTLLLYGKLHYIVKKKGGNTMKTKVILIISLALFSLSNLLPECEAYEGVEIQPDANTVLLDHLNGSTSSTDVQGVLNFVPSLPVMDLSGDFQQGTFIVYPINTDLRDEGTIEVWLYPHNYSNKFIMCNWIHTYTNPHWGKVVNISVNNEGKISYGAWPGHCSPNPASISSQSSIPVNEWTHIAVSWGPEGTKIYLNGSIDAQVSYAIKPDLYSGHWAYLNEWGESYSSYMDEFHVSNKQRSDEEIQSRVILSPTAVIIAVDGGKSVWKSEDQGLSWTEVNPEFDNTTPKAIVSDSGGNLYILTDLSEIVKSEDGGETWTVINSDYNGGEVRSAWVTMACSKTNDYLYVIEQSGDDVWRSTDRGESWEKVSDNYNGGVNPRPKGAATDSDGNVFVVDRNADIWMSSDNGESWTKINDDYNGSMNNFAGDYVIGEDNHYIVIDVGGVSNVFKSVDGGYTFEDMGKITQYGAVGALAFSYGSLYGAINYGNDGPDIHRSDDEAVTWILGGEITTPFNIIDMTSVD